MLSTNVLGKEVPEKDFVAYPIVDTLYDYVGFVSNGPIAELPHERPGEEVAIIGGGVAGLVAAYELLRAGVRPVVYEATGRIGGRCFSLPFRERDGRPSETDFAEMGAMRFPPSGKLFFHYLNRFGLSQFIAANFPDPGIVPTLLYYENTASAWEPYQLPPGRFGEIAEDWKNLLTLFVTPLYAAWRKSDWDGVRRVWQNYIDRFKNKSFYEAIREYISSWSDADIKRFGSLGIGSGGFGPLYEVNFLEILRVVVNMWEDSQKMLACGTKKFTDSFVERKVATPFGRDISLQEAGAIRLRTAVRRIEYADGQPILVFSDSTLPPKAYKAVIVATTTRSMDYLGLTLPGNSGESILNQAAKTSLRVLHLMNSSKLFIRTETKFWKGTDLPQNIQTDELPRGVYTLDYPQTDRGIVLISYVWGDDSTKLLALGKEQRFDLFKQMIAKASPEFARNLVPMNGEILSVDWDLEPYFHGAFKLQYPGQEPDIAAAYYQFLDALDPTSDRGVYLAGDSVSWSGGWIEGALHTGINAACAAAKRIGANVRGLSPLIQKRNFYRY